MSDVCNISRHKNETRENSVCLDKKRNASDLKRLRSAIGETMRTEEFNKLCERKLGYTTSAWEIEAIKTSKLSVGEPWVRRP